MRVNMHPLCCISLERNGDDQGPCIRSPEIVLSRASSLKQCQTIPGSNTINVCSFRRSDVSIAGALYKWTNYGKGWRSRWFLLRGDGLLSYCKILSTNNLNSLSSSLGDDVTVIGNMTSPRLIRLDSCSRKKDSKRNSAVVHLKVSSFRESRSDVRRFYVFTATKTLHLRTNSKHDKELWLEALASTRCFFSWRSLNDNLPISPDSISISTEKLKRRLVEDGVNESLVKECEQIMLSEFSEIQGKLKALCEERSNLLGTLRQLEAANFEAEALGISDSGYQLSKSEYSSLEGAKYCECSTTESSNGTEKPDVGEASDEEEPCYYDSKDYFTESPSHLIGSGMDTKGQHGYVKDVSSMEASSEAPCSHIERRKKLPDPVEKEKHVSLWSMIKGNVGKDLTRVCLPVYFNEPISSLQKCCEDLEYSYLLDRAYEYGKMGNDLMRIVYVAAFAASGYASTEGRHCKPFNPLLGETYEADFPEKGFRFFSEKVSHHPTLIACHCEGRGWKFWADSNLKTRFWGQTIQLDPLGILTLEFEDGERFQWSKVTTSIHNLIIGKIYCDHHGTMNIGGNHQYSCKLKFKGQTFLDRNPRQQVYGVVEDATGNNVATIFGRWDDSIYYIEGDAKSKLKDLNLSNDATLVWRRTKPAPDLTRYNLTHFAITLNELTPGLKEKLPPTDSRLRPDQRHLENGEYERAYSEKLRLETRQRMSTKLQEDGWRPRWFARDGEDGTYHYTGGYWEAREQGNWDGCPDIFGEIIDEADNLSQH
ncbi:oxysterol-binding protein-related protein 2A-like isoform X1 [Amaranthus tricolor]|uniref:oxysterol-binding protein-related protein 2A-like isoform X1 n=1 Tax=Amaranthus tricolor TaxID=29722 RepID=UPI00258DE851|nr:oxysterol-binding protein-related protein 2A-like isoform X1 [Amaranthus tricolor]XP_057518974.1 oxysterol-binding protein-related protein 2A-like isoform X1 [Amaranthus tricolor]